MRGERITKPCESCGTLLSKTKAEQGQRKYWTCGLACANKLKIQQGLAFGWKTDPLRGKKDTRPCAECGTPVTRRLSQRVTATYWTCSMQCSRKYQNRQRMTAGTWKQPRKPRTGENVPCLTCGKEFYRTPTAIKLNQGRFCSVACHNVGQAKEPVLKQCTGCGKDLRLKPSQSMRQFCSKACEGLTRIKRPQDRIHNGKPAKQDNYGYVMLWEPAHPNKSMKGWQYEHRLMMEKKLGRYLTTDEQVDHIDGTKENRDDNLQVLSASAHSSKTGNDRRKALAKLKAELAAAQAALAAFRERHGELPPES